MRTRRAAFLLFYFATTLVVSLLIVEGLVRWLEIGPPIPPSHKRKFDAKQYLPYHPTPDSRFHERTSEFSVSYQYNAQGLRDRERAIAKPNNVVRILGLGDSFTEGVGVDAPDTYLAQLEELLRAEIERPRGVDVVKAGVAGYDTEAERLFLEHYGVHYQPDLVIVGFTGTDVFEAALGRYLVLSKQGHLLSRGAHAIGPWGVELYVRSRAARIALRWIVDRSSKETMFVKRIPEERQHELRRLGWQRIDQELSRILEISSAAGGQLVVLYIPVKLGFDGYAEEESTRLANWSRAHDVTFVDMLPVFTGRPDSARFFYPRDGHCTPAGNRVIAEELLEQLSRSGWIDRQRDS